MNRIAKSLVLAALLVAALSVATPPAAAKTKPCWQRLIDDWYDGRIDKVYPVKCYQEALDNAPEEAETYTSLPEDLRRALASAVRTGSNNVSAGGKGRSTRVKNQQPRTKRSGTKGATAKLDPNTPVPAGGIRSAEPTGGDDSPFFDAKSADSVPIPLLIMAGLALLLMTGGAAGMVTRRMQARRVPVGTPTAPAGPDGPPPA